MFKPPSTTNETPLHSSKYFNSSRKLFVFVKRKAYAVMGTNTLQEIACITVSACLITNLTTINGKTDSRPIFDITLNNSTAVAQWSAEEYLRLGVHDLNHLRGDITSSFKIADETIVIHNNMVVNEQISPLCRLMYQQQISYLANLKQTQTF